MNAYCVKKHDPGLHNKFKKYIMLCFTSSSICYSCINARTLHFFYSLQRRTRKCNSKVSHESAYPHMDTHTHTHQPCSAIITVQIMLLALCLFMRPQKKTKNKSNVTQLQLFHLRADNTRCCRLCLGTICPAASLYLLFQHTVHLWRICSVSTRWKCQNIVYTLKSREEVQFGQAPPYVLITELLI